MATARDFQFVRGSRLIQLTFRKAKKRKTVKNNKANKTAKKSRLYRFHSRGGLMLIFQEQISVCNAMRRVALRGHHAR